MTFPDFPESGSPDQKVEHRTFRKSVVGSTLSHVDLQNITWRNRCCWCIARLTYSERWSLAPCEAEEM